MTTWQCVKRCGACCQLDPTDRPELEDYLSEANLALYLSLVGPDGWCINYDADQRECRIYPDRPSFCRVEPTNFESMFGVPADEFNDFAIDCCQQQIEGVYGDRSEEMERFNTAIGFVEDLIEDFVGDLIGETEG
jgi:hypothetical protein